MNNQSQSYWYHPKRYRNGAMFIALIGSVLLWQHHGQQNLSALMAVVLLFIGAVLGMVSVFLSLKLEKISILIQSLLLILWNVGFPLIIMVQAYHQ